MKKLTAIIFLAFSLLSCQKQDVITLETLLNEMTSYEIITQFPDPYYTCHQASSYDRRSVSPDSAYWGANDDGYQGGHFIRIDTINGRIEKVMLDHKAPGVITRIWITSLDKKAQIKFYFDGSDEAQFIIPAYDLTQIGIEGLGEGMVFPHIHWNEESVGGSTSYFPIPYAKSCKVTVEIDEEVVKNPRYYQINYRSYDNNTQIQTFSNAEAALLKDKIKKVNTLLLDPQQPEFELISVREKGELLPGSTTVIHLPEGENLISQMRFEIDIPDSLDYGKIMRELGLSIEFDGEETVNAPLGDFAGGGIGAYSTDSWYFENNGKGYIDSRWPMPYKKNGKLTLTNSSDYEIIALINVMSKKKDWSQNTMYFHASWKQENGIHLFHCADDISNLEALPYEMASLTGKGVFKGDVLSLINYSESWYGEGDEQIWIDDDSFPSHFGTGTEDYYNSSWAPVRIFHTPFGGAARADSTNSRGHSTWYRTRNLDGIPFQKKLQFDLELLSWYVGKADYSSTIFWYGNNE
ncbi:MAG: glycoside hydrolase family 172 protein [Bacteroidota bacterium]|nr:glycoside hydrolase family 172 protein [Bacteroidota bacterium]